MPSADPTCTVADNIVCLLGLQQSCYLVQSLLIALGKLLFPPHIMDREAGLPPS